MKTPPAATCVTIAILVFACAGPAKSSADRAAAVQGDAWSVALTAKSHTHAHGEATSANEQQLKDEETTYSLSLTERVQGTEDGGSVDIGEEGMTVTPQTSSGAATERLHTRHAVERDLQEQWVNRDGTLDAPPSGAGMHFAWDGSAHQGMLEVTGHYSGTESSRNHTIFVSNNVDRTDTNSTKWIQSQIFGGNSTHPVTIKQTKTGFTVDWAWTESTHDPNGATKDVDQSGHADIHR